jgi:hypothetical protein
MSLAELTQAQDPPRRCCPSNTKQESIKQAHIDNVLSIRETKKLRDLSWGRWW